MTPGLCSVLLNEAELPVFEARPKFISLYQEGEVSSLVCVKLNTKLAH